MSKLDDELDYVLPSQVFHHFRDSSLDELRVVALSYSGKKKNPTLQEWIEGYQQNKFLQKVIQFDERGLAIADKLLLAEKELADGEVNNLLVVDPKAFKSLKAEVKRLNSLFNSNEQYLSYLHKQLSGMVQEQLKREAPRLVNVNNTFTINPQQMGAFLSDSEDELKMLDAEELD